MILVGSASSEIYPYFLLPPGRANLSYCEVTVCRFDTGAVVCVLIRFLLVELKKRVIYRGLYIAFYYNLY